MKVSGKQEKLTLAEKENRFWRLVQREAKKRNSVFFLDVGSGKEIDTGTLRAIEAFGWLIPERYAEAFRKEWEKKATADEWDRYFVNEDFRLYGEECYIWFDALPDYSLPE